MASLLSFQLPNKGMANANANYRKCFTFIWKIENASYLWSRCEVFPSPVFVVSEIERSQWRLHICPFKNKKIQVSLLRFDQFSVAESVDIEWQVTLLASNGAVLLSSNRRKNIFLKYPATKEGIILADSKDIFLKRRSEFLPQDTLTVSCKIWKGVGEMLEAVQWMASTRIGVEKRSFLWKVGKISSLESKKKHTYEIRSYELNQLLLSLDLLFIENSEEISFAVTPRMPLFFCEFQLSVVDDSGKTIEYLREKFLFDASSYGSISFAKRLSKAALMGKSDFLSIRCVCRLPSEMMSDEFERVISGGDIFENSEMKNHCVGRKKESKNVISDSNNLENSEKKNLCFDLRKDSKNVVPDLKTFQNSETGNLFLNNENVLSVRKNVLINDLKSILSDGILPDIKLKTSSKTYPAHKCILSARSPVFKAMFSTDMKEKIKECVNIEDLNDDTVFRMLRYIYCAELKELDWDSATQLYEASDKYEILTLRDECSSYLKNNLCEKKACEALLLADMHHDENMKSFVQDFILKHGDAIINSEEWEKLMNMNLKLAADTLRLKFKGSTSK